MARDKSGKTPLYYAAGFGTPEHVQFLLAAGADLMTRDAFGQTPLHWVAKSGSKVGVIEALLEAGADPKAKDEDGKTPWNLAQKNDKLKDTKSYWALNDARFK